MFAATYPDRVRALVIWNGQFRGTWAPDYPWAAPREEALREIGERERRWPASMLEGIEVDTPSLDPAEREAFAEVERVLATVLFTDIVGSTARAAGLGDRAWRVLLESHHSVIRDQLVRFRGTEHDTAGDGFFASSDGPARAIRCARAIRDALKPLDLEVRAGIHTGECELLDGKVSGIAVATGARVAAHASPGEVLVSQTVKDLVAGSDITFDDCGTHELRGIPGEWRLYAVNSS